MSPCVEERLHLILRLLHSAQECVPSVRLAVCLSRRVLLTFALFDPCCNMFKARASRERAAVDQSLRNEALRWMFKA